MQHQHFPLTSQLTGMLVLSISLALIILTRRQQKNRSTKRDSEDSNHQRILNCRHKKSSRHTATCIEELNREKLDFCPVYHIWPRSNQLTNDWVITFQSVFAPSGQKTMQPEHSNRNHRREYCILKGQQRLVMN